MRLCPARNHVDGSAESLTSGHARSSAFENFDALNIRNVKWKIGRVMACLRIDKRNAVKKNRNLVVRSAMNADVSLHTKTASLPDINARGQFKNVINAGHTGRVQIVARQRHHLSCRHAGRHWRTRSRDNGRFAQRQCVGSHFRQVFRGVAFSMSSSSSGQTRCGRGQRGCAQHADANLAMQTAEQTPTLAVEVAERQHARCLFRVVEHKNMN